MKRRHFLAGMAAATIGSGKAKAWFPHGVLPSPIVVGGTTVLRLTSISQVAAFRALVINEVFSGAGLPATGADTTTLNVTSPITTQGQTGPSNLLQVDAYTFDVKDDTNTIVGTTAHWWCFRPTSGTKNNKLVIHSFGHNDTGSEWTEGNQALLVKTLVEAGYTVCSGEMSPFQGTAGQIVAAHNALPARTVTYNPLRIYVQGPIRAVNKLLPEGFTKVFSCGYSGGGWMQPLFGAVDTRVSAFSSHAGWFPLYMTNSLGNANNHDYEDYLHGVSALNIPACSLTGCDYTDLAVLACLPNRSMLQSFDDTDPITYDLATYQEYQPYIPSLVTAIGGMGGSYSGTFDSYNQHGYSTTRVTAILNYFNAS